MVVIISRIIIICQQNNSGCLIMIIQEIPVPLLVIISNANHMEPHSVATKLLGATGEIPNSSTTPLKALPCALRPHKKDGPWLKLGSGYLNLLSQQLEGDSSLSYGIQNILFSLTIDEPVGSLFSSFYHYLATHHSAIRKNGHLFPHRSL